MTDDVPMRSEDYADGFAAGLSSVRMIRCIKHRGVLPYNANEIGGGECAACEIDAKNAEIRGLVNQKWVRKEDHDKALNRMEVLSSIWEQVDDADRLFTPCLGLVAYKQAVGTWIERGRADLAAYDHDGCLPPKPTPTPRLTRLCKDPMCEHSIADHDFSGCQVLDCPCEAFAPRNSSDLDEYPAAEGGKQ